MKNKIAARNREEENRVRKKERLRGKEGKKKDMSAFVSTLRKQGETPRTESITH